MIKSQYKDIINRNLMFLMHKVNRYILINITDINIYININRLMSDDCSIVLNFDLCNRIHNKKF